MSRKRDQRKREAARAKSGSPYRLIGAAGDIVTCVINADWEDEGMASIHLLRRVPGGGHASAAFLLDFWCLGLKDAWGQLDTSYDDFQEYVIERTAETVNLIPLDIAAARRMVAGGIRVAEENGFRLPPRYERWTAMLGNIGNWRTADLSDFGYDGGLFYQGPEDDLRRRLLHGTLEDFLARPNVEAEFYEIDGNPYSESDGDMEQVGEMLKQAGLAAVRKWCFANRQMPHPLLGDAWDIMFESLMQLHDVPTDAHGAPATEGDGAEEVARQGLENLADLLAVESPQRAAELGVALEQIKNFMGSFQSSSSMFASFGWDASEFDDNENRDAAAAERGARRETTDAQRRPQKR